MNATVDKTKRANQHELGGLNIGYSYIAMCGKLPELLTSFESRYPKIIVQPHSAASTHQLEKLLHDELDFCFLTGPIESTNIETHLFQMDKFVVIVQNDHPLASKGSMSVSELAKEKILMCCDTTISKFNEHVFDFLEAAQLHPEVEMIPQSHVGLLGLVTLGRGVCVATEGYGCIFAKELSVLKLTGTDQKLPTLMAWRKNHSTAARQTFLNYVQEQQRSQAMQESPEAQQEAEVDIS